MEFSLAEVRLWDTYRLREPTLAFSKVNVTRLHMPAVVSYWRMVYEMTNLGKGLFDYNINQNNEYIIPSNTQWDSAIQRLEVCNHTHRYDIATGTCTTTFQDDVMTDSHDFNFVNSTFFSLIDGQS